MQDMVTTAELCRRLKVHKNTLLNWRKEGMPYYKPRRNIFYDYDEVKAWMKKEGVKESE